MKKLLAIIALFFFAAPAFAQGNRGLVMLLESPIRIPVFHFLNKKHRNLPGPLAAEIQKMKKSGAIRKIFQNYYRNSKSGYD